MTWMNKTAGGFPLYPDRARGARVTDLDGHEYVDFASATPARWRATRRAPVVEAVTRRLADRAG